MWDPSDLDPELVPLFVLCARRVKVPRPPRSRDADCDRAWRRYESWVLRLPHPYQTPAQRALSLALRWCRDVERLREAFPPSGEGLSRRDVNDRYLDKAEYLARKSLTEARELCLIADGRA